MAKCQDCNNYNKNDKSCSIFQTIISNETNEHECINYKKTEVKKITFEEYIKKCKRTYAWQGTPNMEVCMLSMGLAGETGEIIDYLKKVGFQGKPFEKDKLINEMGDMMWYFAMLCNFFDIKFEDILFNNIEKLHKRYPNGFEVEKSEHRESECTND